MNQSRIDQLDSNFSASPLAENLQWHDAKSLHILGQGWSPDQLDEPYDRLPAKAEKIVRDPVWNLSQRTTGLNLQFETNSPALAIRWLVRFSNNTMYHMARVGEMGFDLYGQIDDKWRFAGSTTATDDVENQVMIFDQRPKQSMLYQLNFPLYNGVKELQIGIIEGHSFEEKLSYDPTFKPIVFYGTSITQGGCASRPGMAYTSIISRRLNYPAINHGYSGNGKLEPEMAHLLTEIDPAVYVIDPFPNNFDIALIENKLTTFITILRQAKPHTPIIIVGNAMHQQAPFISDYFQYYQAFNQHIQKIVAQLQAQNFGRLAYVPGNDLLGDDHDATVDGVHPTDLGFARMADVLTPAIAAQLALVKA